MSGETFSAHSRTEWTGVHIVRPRLVRLYSTRIGTSVWTARSIQSVAFEISKDSGEDLRAHVEPPLDGVEARGAVFEDVRDKDGPPVCHALYCVAHGCAGTVGVCRWRLLHSANGSSH